MTPEQTSLTARVGELVKAAGIENFRIEDNMLLMCGIRYAIEKCTCDDPECNGLKLRREDGGPSALAAMQ